MNKYYCIEPATKDKNGVCVLPTMQEPESGDILIDALNSNDAVSKRVLEWEKHINIDLPKFLTSCDRVGWFEASEKWHVHTSSYQGESDHYFDTEAEADDKYWEWANWNGNLQAHTDKPRKFIVPQSEEKFELKYCDMCNQMTNHKGNECGKCGAVLLGHIVDDFANKKETFIPASEEKDGPGHKQ
jgi:hypothetical protein